MKVSVKTKAGSQLAKLGMEDCLYLSQNAWKAACGLGYASHQLSKSRRELAKDKEVQVVDVVAGLATSVRFADDLSKALKDRGYEGLAKKAKGIKDAASKLNKEVKGGAKKAGVPLGRVGHKEVEKLENSVEKLKARMEAIWQETKDTCVTGKVPD